MQVKGLYRPNKGDYIVMALPDTTPKPVEPAAPKADSASTPSEVQGYCVKCKEKRDFQGTVEVSKTSKGFEFASATWSFSTEQLVAFSIVR